MVQWSRELWQSRVGLGLFGGLISRKMRTSFSRHLTLGLRDEIVEDGKELGDSWERKRSVRKKSGVQGLRETKCPDCRALATSEELKLG